MSDLPVLKLMQSAYPPNEDAEYIHNAYFVVDSQDEKNIFVRHSVSPCRDSFLHHVYEKFSGGAADSITIGLVLPYTSIEEATPVLRAAIFDFDLTGVVNLSCNVIDYGTLGGKVPRLFRTLLFSVTKNQYKNPAAFWLATEHVRKTVCRYTKVPEDGRYALVTDYSYICTQLRNKSTVVGSGVFPNLSMETFFKIHSPLGLCYYINSLERCRAALYAKQVRGERLTPPTRNERDLPKVLALYGNLKLTDGLSLETLFRLEK